MACDTSVTILSRAVKNNLKFQCECKNGFVRDENQNCIPEHSCPVDETSEKGYYFLIQLIIILYNLYKL